MRRINWKTVSTLVTVGLLAGCSDSIVEPKANMLMAPETAAMSRAPAGRPAVSMTTVVESNTAATFTVGPEGGVYMAGNAAVFFPAQSICDPATSSYGMGSWDDSCTPLRSTITITAVTRVANGRSQVDFTPSLRFVPSNNPNRWVWLYMRVPSLAGTRDLEAYKIFYSPTLDGELIDESVADPSLRTYVDLKTGTSLRRVKHFSGYTVTTRDCESGTEGCGSEPETQK